MIVKAAVIGLGATILMDVWAQILAFVPGQPKVSWAPVGRWVWHVFRGRFVHDDIGKAQSVTYESLVGWMFHYAVGLGYGVVFVLLVGRAWLAHPSFLPAWIFGLVTVGAGWFVLQPALGLGIGAAHVSRRWHVRGLNIIAHTVFAFGLYATARGLN